MSKLEKTLKFLTLFLATLVIFSATVVSVSAQAKLTEQSQLFLKGIGTVRVGMTVAEASKAAGRRLVSQGESGGGNDCYYIKPERTPVDVAFMVTGGRISRVDVWRNSRVTTLSGARIGDTEARIKSLYPGRIQVSLHHYVQGGHYLTFVPKDAADRNYRLLFETDGKRVTQFRSGKLPEVEFSEGCA